MRRTPWASSSRRTGTSPSSEHQLDPRWDDVSGSMTGFIIRRLGQAIIVVLGVTLITFILLHLLPGSLARDILGNRATPQAIEQFNHQNHSGPARSSSSTGTSWTSCCTATSATRYQFNRSVDSLLATDLPRDLVLGGLSLIFSLMIAIPTGIAQAVKRNGALDYAGTGVSFLLYSMPQYAIALLLIQFLSISFHVFPAEAPQSTSAIGMLEHPTGLVLPVLSLTLVTYAASAGTCAPRRSTRSPRTTSGPPARRACPSDWC